jgi:predicted molibdopterin-dependent oxidoreductase YjgC
MFRRLTKTSEHPVTIFINGAAASARQGDTVAAAILASGHLACRTTAISGVPRGPYCLMGVCFDCLVTIDGTGNRQACMTLVREGMRVETQHGKREYGT